MSYIVIYFYIIKLIVSHVEYQPLKNLDDVQVNQNTRKIFDRISMEISTLLSPNSQPEIMFLESILDSDLFSDIISAQSTEASFQVNSSKSESSESLHHISPVNQSSRRSFNLTQESPTKVHLPSLNKHQSTLTIYAEFEDQEKRKELEAKIIIVEKLRSRLDSLKQNSFAHKLNRFVS